MVHHQVLLALLQGFRAAYASLKRAAALLAAAIGKRLQHRLIVDSLTGLPNRDEYLRILGAAIIEEQAAEGSLAVLALDIDRFKSINAAIGRERSDELLRRASRRLARLVRPGDLVAHAGGDRFLVLLRQIGSAEQVATVGRRLLRELRQPYQQDGAELFATLSIGASLYPPHALLADELVAHADAACYAAKQRGRDGLCLYSEETRAFTSGRLQLEAELRDAVSRGQFELHYQPQLNIASGRIVGLEALLRWRHPSEGLLAPDRFIGTAEETGQIAPLTGWIVGEACRQMREWRRAGLTALRVAVNLPALQPGDAGVAEQVRAALALHPLPPGCLEVEITESAVMRHLELSARTLGELRELEVQIAIDDFGTGYSALGALQRLPIQRLKIDRGFVADLGVGNDSDSIARAIIALGRNLHLQVIAEGVETLEQLECLRSLGCDEYQGCFCSRALPAAEIPAFLRNWESAAPGSGAAIVRAAG